MKTKPILFGYQNVRISATSAEVLVGRQRLAAYAIREGYALADVFVERDSGRPSSALNALIATARREPGAVVAVPTQQDLGRLPRVRQLIRWRLEREAGVQVLIVENGS